jgi:hypothetical protein
MKRIKIIQDRYAAAMKPFGLEIEEKRSKHPYHYKGD